MEPLTLTIKDVATHLRVSRVATVRDMIGRGELPSPDFRVGGRPRWVRSHLIAWLDCLSQGGQMHLKSNGAATHPKGGEESGSLAGEPAQPQKDSEGASRSLSTDEEARDAG